MPNRAHRSLLDWLTTEGSRADQVFCGVKTSVGLAELINGSILSGRISELRGRSVLLAVKDQLTAGLALIEIDGISRRIVLCPPGVPPAEILTIARTAEVDAVICGDGIELADLSAIADLGGIGCVATSSSNIAAREGQLDRCCETEWVLLTSGTTGTPKLVAHTLSSLAAPIKIASASAISPVWSTFYDIRRYGGLQIFLRAVLGGGSLVLSSAEEATSDFLIRAGKHGVTHISGTPSHWRRALMSPQAHAISPRYLRLSGEIADQSILDHLQSTYPGAAIGHAFASTEAGVAFEVDDGLSGFPGSLIGRRGAEVELKIVNGSLLIRSPRIARGYIGTADKQLVDGEGFVDTGDVVELLGKRYHFVGRADGVINVGGRKVHPEEVEAVINRHPDVQMAIVRGRKSPITGAVVVADVVVKYRSSRTASAAEAEALQREIIGNCQLALAPHKVPVTIHIVTSLGVTGSGKLVRFDA